MVTQTITINLMQSRLAPIIMRSEEKGRKIQFEVINEAGEPEDLTDYSLKFMMIKPDDNVVYADLASGILTQTEQMTTSKGKGYYCIRIMDEDTIIYSGQGPVVIDDHVIDDETLDSISEVDGLVFPDDFYTRDDNVAIIDDNVISTDKTWSSSKIADEISSTNYTETATGNPIEFTDAADAPVVSLKTEIQGSQDLHGYDKPWVGGAGKNKLPLVLADIKSANTDGTWSGNAYTHNGVTFTVMLDGGGNVTSIKVVGNPSGNSVFVLCAPLSFSSGNYVLNGSPSGGATNSFKIDFYKQDWSYSVTDTGSGANITLKTDTQDMRARIVVYSGYTIPTGGIIFYPMIRLSTETDPTFAPYSNICPITAVSTGDIEVSDGDTITTHTTAFSPAIYKGSEDVANSTISIEWDMIASYAGETLPGEWISDRDEYVPGTTPTTGAQVAYELAAPLSASVLPSNLPIRTRSGYTRIESSTGDMDVEYIKSSAQSLVDLIEAVTR